MAVTAHLGIRYAHHTERFAPAEPVGSGSVGSRSVGNGSVGNGAGFGATATELTDVPIFPQLPGRLDAAMGEALQRNPQSEDAYFLNVWAPEGAQAAPVLVFIHGGAWTTGGGSACWYDGSTLADRGLVVVTMNYRLGPLAHLAPDSATDPTPLAIGDLLHALRWVRDNVAAFGGDPARVTLAGQSTGGWYAHVLNLLPEAAGLFDRVALWSMATRRPWTSEQLAGFSARTAALAGTDLRSASIDDLLAAGSAALREQSFPFGTPGSAYLPAESPILPTGLYDAATAARGMHAARLWVRWTAAEAGAFLFASPERGITAAQWAEILDRIPVADRSPRLGEVGADPYAALVAQTSRQLFERFPQDLAEAARAEGRGVLVTHFDTQSDLAGFGSGHTLDLPYQFGDPAQWPDCPMLAGEDPDRFARVSGELIADTLRFAGL